ncbi:MAG TPA: CRTAC1 family protein [Thermoanaerobaculia bacterium]|nr:CRTAC1 family protein [Thermoanaerobaculia bacterium]
MRARGSLLAALLLVLLAAAPPAAASAIRFRDAAARWGLDFRHHNAASGRRYMVETMVGGLVIFDYDGDGDEDVFFVDGGPLPGYAGEPARSRLLRNDGGLRFVDVTARAGIAVSGYGAGATAGDVDGDGDLDLFVSELGPNQLFRNDGDGRFTEVTAAAGVGDPAWSAGAAFADVDRDGDLDLYVADYADFTPAKHKDCREPTSGIVGYCKPQAYRGLPDHFYRNGGDGRFVDATAAAGLAGPALHGLGVGFADLDGDGWPDLYVADDLDPNLLFHNRGDGTFEEVGALSGTALSPQAKAEAGMGVDLDDYDGDGRLDVVVTNFDLETYALYRNLGDLLFSDARYVAHLAEPTLMYLGFGVDFADLDQDGDLDLVFANGHVNDVEPQLRKGAQFAQRNQVFENRGDGTFREVTDSGMDLVRVHRGLATGDLDGDGDLDLVILASNDLAEAWENQSGEPVASRDVVERVPVGGDPRNNVSTGGRSLLVDLAGTGNTFGVGARVSVQAGGRTQVREVRTGSSYLSQHAMSVHFGLGENVQVDRLLLRWPDGRQQAIAGVPTGRRLRLGAGDRP